MSDNNDKKEPLKPHPTCETCEFSESIANLWCNNPSFAVDSVVGVIVADDHYCSAHTALHKNEPVNIPYKLEKGDSDG